MKVKMFDERVNKKVLQFFSSLADETRLKILISLVNGPKNVNEIHNCIGKDKMTLSAISHQLKQLNDIDVIFYKREGKEKRFNLTNKFCWCILRDAFKHFNGTKCKSCNGAKNNE